MKIINAVKQINQKITCTLTEVLTDMFIAVLFVIVVLLLQGCVTTQCLPVIQPVISTEIVPSLCQVNVLDKEMYLQKITIGLSCKF